jgi:hypothetical protein
MTDLLIFAAPVLMLALLFCAWRAAILLLVWVPTTAQVAKGGYSALEQQDDFWHGGASLTTLRGYDLRDGEDSRLIEDEVVFTDDDGAQHRALVERRVARGWRPDGLFTIWYHPADPARVTAFGPFHWAMLSLLCAAALAGLFTYGLQLAAVQ